VYGKDVNRKADFGYLHKEQFTMKSTIVFSNFTLETDMEVALGYEVKAH
jgi:hypothetical protein